MITSIKKSSIKIGLLIVLLGVFITPLNTHAKPAVDKKKDEVRLILPNPRFEKISSANAVVLSQYHYSKLPIDDVLSERIYTLYMSALDPQRVYFLQADIDHFEKNKHSFDDYLRRSDLMVPFQMYNTLIKRIEERDAKIVKLIDANFDLTTKDTILINRKNEPYAKTEQELDDLWKDRIKNELITILLSDDKLSVEDAKKKLKKRYATRHERLLQVDDEDVFEIYLNAVALAFDPHSGYMSAKTVENFNINMSLSLQGIGAVLRQDEDSIKIMEMVAGGPAEQSNQMVVGDEIIGVAQGDDGEFLDVVGMRLDKVVDRIRGEKGTVVRLQILSNKGKGPEKVVRIVRDKVKLEQQAAKSSVKKITRNGKELNIGVITLPAFYSDFEGSRKGNKEYRSTTRDIKKLLNEMKKNAKIDGLVIDLRGNGGGSLEEVINLSALFIGKNKTVVQTKTYDEKISEQGSQKERKIYDGPLLVITDRTSASASEIFAGSIQDQDRGIIVGTTTFGKGTVQTLVSLDSFWSQKLKPGQTKVTIAKFYRANGDSTQEKGVIPDIILPGVYNESEIGESSEKYVLPWDQIRASKDYILTNNIKIFLPELTKLHQSRMESDPKLKLFKAQRDEIIKLWDTKTLSLNLDVRKKELTQKENESFSRDNEVRRLYGLESLTLEQFRNEDGSYTKMLKESTPDVILDESVEIMGDYIDLLNKNK